MSSDSTNLDHELSSASREGRYFDVLDLLQRGADPNKYTPLHWACNNNHSLCLEALVKWGGSLNRTTDGGWTALHWACAWNSMECVKILLKHHSPTDIKDKKGRTAVHLARVNENTEVAEHITHNKPLPRGIETLPQELQRNFTVMRTLDQKTEDIKTEIDRCSQSYRQEMGKLSESERGKELGTIQEMFKKAIENSDNKVQIAMQMYEMVDKHIRRLDGELTRFEQELQLKDPHQRRTSTGSISELHSSLQQKGRKRTGGSESGGSVARKKKLLSVSEDVTDTLTSPIPSILPSTNPTDVLDMPVDPNEPTYCLCHQVSFGEMIGCDNIDCPIEWFHFQCVGLAAKPKGKWYCPKCSQEKEKHKKKY